ncbi:MAG: hypothetical protein O8C66_08680 [Candidatus Methanoperedens sp.]|nr:hypothetical protein [Candidatus Methanoperedens sp.]MCZ7370570.1 hypothetical protein [Candidatus Methanoperedens sp.]
MKLNDWMLVIANFMLVVATLMLVVATYGLYIATTDVAKYTQHLANYTYELSKSDDQIANLTQKYNALYELDARPWISIEPCSNDLEICTDSPSGTLKFRTKNIGKLPAKIDRIGIGLGPFVYDPVFIPIPFSALSMHNVDDYLLPGTEIVEQFDNSELDKKYNLSKNGKYQLLASIRLEYSTVNKGNQSIIYSISSGSGYQTIEVTKPLVTVTTFKVNIINETKYEFIPYRYYYE